MSLLGTKPGKYIKDIINSIEKEIVNGNLTNDENGIKNYILKYWSTHN